MSVETCNAMTETMVVERATALPIPGKLVLQCPGLQMPLNKEQKEEIL